MEALSSGLNPSRRQDPDPLRSQEEGRIRLASGWWGWSRVVELTPGQWAPNEQRIEFWHEVHRHWRISVQVERSWAGGPSPEALARSANKLEVQDDLGNEYEVFVTSEYIFVQRGRGDLGVLLPHDGRPLAELTEDEIQKLLKR